MPLKEVSRLLSIRRLTASPYHPACNGLVEKFNGTLKQMLMRLCHEQPRQWHRFTNPLLFAYREARQEAKGFSHLLNYRMEERYEALWSEKEEVEGVMV